MSPQNLEKIKIQMTTILDNGHRKTQKEFLRVFAKIIPAVADIFRDSFIIPELAKFAINVNSAKNGKSRKKIILGLIPAYSALNGCHIETELKSKFILPGLEVMHQHANLLDPQDKRDLTDLYTEMRRTLTPRKKEEQPLPWWQRLASPTNEDH